MSARALLLLALLAAAGFAQAAEPPAPPPARDHARIDQHAGAAAAGRIAVNQAAGSGNTQVNLAAIAVSSHGPGLVTLGARQQATAARARDASARIQDTAFAGSRGLLSINQAAGSGNAQANLFAIGQLAPGSAPTVFSGVDDAALAAVAGDRGFAPADGPPPVREARIDAGAFRGSQGVVQVNQTAGVGNQSFNAIVLQLPGAP